MSNIEETLWNYIDGTCTPDEEQAISRMIEVDEAYRAKYLEIIALNQEFAAMELDEPPMAFTYNVMEAIRAENAQKPLKASINPVIIKGIAAFFVFTITMLLVVSLASIHWSAADTGTLFTSFKMPDLSKYFNGPIVKGFMFFDTVMGLFLFDTYLRKRNASKQS
ncbi:MAG: anti-sigma factor family protein [Mucilaginibacter sp.]